MTAKVNNSSITRTPDADISERGLAAFKMMWTPSDDWREVFTQLWHRQAGERAIVTAFPKVVFDDWQRDLLFMDLTGWPPEEGLTARFKGHVELYIGYTDAAVAKLAEEKKAKADRDAEAQRVHREKLRKA